MNPELAGNESQMSGLDAASQQFLTYALGQATHDHKADAKGRRWVQFEQFAQPGVHNKQVAAQAFLHVLSLASKNAVSVEQDGADNAIPFGAIHIGLPGFGAD